jgi:ribokinase
MSNERAPVARVAVVGGFNMDLVFRAPRRPLAGETLVGTAFAMFMGGKGSNQAIAAARAGGRVEMIGRLGADSFGQDIAAALDLEGIGLRYAVRDEQEGTGVAGIVVEPDGTNSIVVVPRANMRLSAEDIRQARDAIAGAAVLLLQLETPVEASEAAARIARASGATVILNPAPARELPVSLWALVDVLVPNEREAEQLTGLPVATEQEAARAAAALLGRGVGSVVITLGARGALVLDGQGPALIPSYPLQAVDTTAAGDAFCGALAVALAEGRSLRDAVRFACAAGALSVTVMGAAPSLPRREAIEWLLAGATGVPPATAGNAKRG